MCRRIGLEPSADLEPVHAGHHFIQQHQIKSILLQRSQGIFCIGHRCHLVALALKEHDMGLQMINFIIGPEYAILL